jgi:hypothetical protein
VEILGSETNTVHLYQRDISRPLLSYKFDDQNNGAVKTTATVNTDRVKKEETGTEFVSAMCWSNVCVEFLVENLWKIFLFLFLA